MLRPENPRRALRVALAAGAAAAAFCGSLTSATAGTTSIGDLAGHPYRHGLVQTLGANDLPNLGLNNLSYGGGTGGVGVTTGAEKVYLVFWGSQWGTSGTDANGYTTLSGDPQRHRSRSCRASSRVSAPTARRWSGVMTQYCEGVASGTTTCPASAAHVALPDRRRARRRLGRHVGRRRRRRRPATQFGAEADAAAAHFGNTTASVEPQRAVRDPLADRHAPGRVQHHRQQLLRVARLHR